MKKKELEKQTSRERQREKTERKWTTRKNEIVFFQVKNLM